MAELAGLYEHLVDGWVYAGYGKIGVVGSWNLLPFLYTLGNQALPPVIDQLKPDEMEW